MNQLWMISYDIVDDKIRKAVFECLKNHGQAVQFSVFECYLTTQTQQTLRRELLALIEIADDSIRWYPLCRWCHKDIDVLGSDKTTTDEAFYIV